MQCDDDAFATPNRDSRRKIESIMPIWKESVFLEVEVVLALSRLSRLNGGGNAGVSCYYCINLKIRLTGLSATMMLS
eukprot:scaffold18628_cov128-Skeletonema_marinoi.AAC.5